MGIRRRASASAAVLGLATLGLSGCSINGWLFGGTSGNPCGGAFAMCSEPLPSPTETCEGISAEEALETALAEMPPPFHEEHMQDVTWTAEHADLDGYRECAELSYLLVTIEGGTASSPVQVAFFHGDEFIGTATEPAMGFWPEVEQADDMSVSVTWRYPEAGDTNADPSGEATAVFSWNDETQILEREGELPPAADGS